MNAMEVLTEQVLVGGVVALSAAVVIHALLRREAAARPDAWWSNEWVMYIVHAPIITILAAAGGVFTVAGLNQLSAQPVTPQGLGVAGSAVLLAVAVKLVLPRETSARSRDEGGVAGAHAVTASN